MTDTPEYVDETPLTVEHLVRVLRDVELQCTDGNSLYLVQLLAKALEGASDTNRPPKSESLDDLERSERLSYTAPRYRELHERHMEQRRLERAVIEAARRLRTRSTASSNWRTRLALFDAVKALEEAEHD